MGCITLLAPLYARPQFLAIPLDHVQLVEFTEDDKNQMPILRIPRHVATSKVSKMGGYYQGQPTAEASSHFEQSNFNPHEYVDYGAHTGHHGAFGWYADFPVQKDS